MEIVIKTILRQIITQCPGTEDMIKKLASCYHCGRKSGLKTVAFLLRLSIHVSHCWKSHVAAHLYRTKVNIADSDQAPHNYHLLTHCCFKIGKKLINTTQQHKLRNEPVHEISNNVVCATSKASD